MVAREVGAKVAVGLVAAQVVVMVVVDWEGVLVEVE